MAKTTNKSTNVASDQPDSTKVAVKKAAPQQTKEKPQPVVGKAKPIANGKETITPKDKPAPKSNKKRPIADDEEIVKKETAAEDAEEDEESGSLTLTKAKETKSSQEKEEAINMIHAGFVLFRDVYQSASPGFTFPALPPLAAAPTPTSRRSPTPGGDDDKKKKKKKDPKDPNRPHRPKNGFVLYCEELRQELSTQEPRVMQKDIMTLAGQEWRKMDSKKKEAFNARAKESLDKFHVDLIEYYRNFPDRAVEDKFDISNPPKHMLPPSDDEEDDVIKQTPSKKVPVEEEESDEEDDEDENEVAKTSKRDFSPSQYQTPLVLESIANGKPKPTPPKKSVPPAKRKPESDDDDDEEEEEEEEVVKRESAAVLSAEKMVAKLRNSMGGAGAANGAGSPAAGRRASMDGKSPKGNADKKKKK
ncbi:hypothetical protein BC829DRAFT_439468 [Chytridium lagenaria]|nr:hypothetical protein BC829DRAFT_439468 [Chytridium lagenaria]